MLCDFTSPQISAANLDRFLVRSAVLRALKKALPEFTGTLLDVGCGYMPYKKLVLSPPSRANVYIGVDLPPNRIYSRRPDVVWDGKKIPLSDNVVDCAMATEVLEHCPDPECVLREIVRVVRPRGRFFFTVPFLWPLHDVPHDEYRYTPFSLRRHLTNTGFREIQLHALGGWDSSLAQMLGLWVRRRTALNIFRGGYLADFWRIR